MLVISLFGLRYKHGSLECHGPIPSQLTGNSKEHTPDVLESNNVVHYVSNEDYQLPNHFKLIRVTVIGKN